MRLTARLTDRLQVPALVLSLATLLLAGVHATAQAADDSAAPAPGKAASAPTEQVIVPQVDRRTLRKPQFPSNDFELGLSGGMYSAQNFGSSGLLGANLDYHVTEDFFVEAALGKSRVSDATFRQVLPGGIFTAGNETLRSREVSLGWNVLPGEVFLGGTRALPSAFYLIGGVGTTTFNGQRLQTRNFGAGVRVYLRDWLAFRLDARDHLYQLDLLGKRQQTQNPSLTAGVSFLF